MGPTRLAADVRRLVFLAWFFSLSVRLCQAQCAIDGRFDIIWVLEGSSVMLADSVTGFDPYLQLVNFMTQLSTSANMGPEAVRQGYVQFAGPLAGLTGYNTIVSDLPLTDSDASSRPDFLLAVNRSAQGGTTNTTGALDFVRTTFLSPLSERADSKQIVFLATMGPPTDSNGDDTDPTLTELAARQIVSETGAKLIFLRFGGAENYPDGYLVNEATMVLDTTLESMQEDLLDSNVLCPLFATESSLQSIVASGSPTQTPTTLKAAIPDATCQNLTLDNRVIVGSVCVGVQASDFLLEYRLHDGYLLSQTNSWVGSNPTTIPYDKRGAPLPDEFPFSSSFVSVPFAALDLGPTCDVYVLPRALVTLATDTGPSVADDVEVFAGDVLFNDASAARIFRNTFPNCQSLTATPSKAPTPAPSPARPEFDFDVIFTTPDVTPEQQNAFAGPISRLSSIFTKDYATETCFEAGTTVCSYTFTNRFCVDDVLVLVSVKSIDGTGGIVSQAGPCVILDQIEQVRVGVLYFDSEDFSTLFENGQFNATLTHQLMHIIGFGSRWDFWGLISSNQPYTYLGHFGQNGYIQAGGSQGSLPEIDSDGFHWSASVFGNELMTPTLQGSTHPLSKMSVMSLKDMGFSVNESRADPYSIPVTSSRLLQSLRLLQAEPSDVLVLPLIEANWTVKPGREDDLIAELAFAAAHMKTLSPTAVVSPSGTSSSEIGIIAGSVVGGLFILILGFVAVVVGRRNRGKKDKSKAKSLEISKPIPQPKPESSPPGNWKEHTDLDGRSYWVNEDTGEFSWTPPEAFTRVPERRPSNVPQPPPPQEVRRIKTAGGDTWSEMTDETGNAFWMNEESGEFSWAAPSGKSFTSMKSGPSSIQRAGSSSSYAAVRTDYTPHDTALVPAQPEEPDSPIVMVEEPVQEIEEFHDNYDENTAGEAGAANADLEAQIHGNTTEYTDASMHDAYDYQNQSLPNYSARSQWE